MSSSLSAVSSSPGQEASDDAHAEARRVDAATIRAQIAANPDHLVVDVRTPGEYASGHIPGSINLPLDQVDEHLNRIVTDAGGHMVLVCQSGGRAGQACAALSAAGLPGLEVLDGGMNAWMQAGAPVDVATDAADAWPIERQVRLVAGSLVAGSILASIRWPAARILAGAVGGGLTYAALSNTCAMGTVLMRLPINKASTADVDAALHAIAR